jgi:acetyl-CoA carboxylase carboxyltransferase component
VPRVTAEATPRPAQDVAHDLLHSIQVERETTMRGDELATERQHAKGKLTARERLECLLDEGSFIELDLFRRREGGAGSAQSAGGAGGARTDGVVTGAGTVYGRSVFVYAQDFRILGGSLGEAHAAKIAKVMDLALAAGAPLIALNDSGGARIQEGVTALAGYGGIFRRNVRASGVIPQISVILGPCAGGAAYSPALTDFVFMVRGTSYMFITGPDVVRAVTGESITHEDLGGAQVHGRQSGVATFTYDDEESCLADVRYLVSLLPANSHDLPPAVLTDDAPDRKCPALLDIVPASR